MKIDLIARPAQIPLALQLSGRIADEATRRRIFLDYQDRRTLNTLRQQQATLAAFRAWLKESAADPGDLYGDPDSWAGLTWGLIADFIRHELAQGYAVSTLNAHLATLKRYAALALQAGSLAHQEYIVIQTITGYSHREARNLDRKRREAGLPTRTGTKAANPILLRAEQIERLKEDHPDTPQGLRDRLMMAVLLDHGLRCGEVAGLMVDDLEQQPGYLVFYRPKVDKIQTHRLTDDARQAAETYLVALGDYPDPASSLLRRSTKNGELLEQGLSERAINRRVGEMGQAIGIDGLSPHDCRHNWATLAARAGTDPFALQEAGGWSSLAMPRRYVEAARVANLEVKLI